jgi:hypothetical protein
MNASETTSTAATVPAQATSHPPESTREVLFRFAFFALACLAVHAILIRFLIPQVLSDTLLGTDSYTRLIRVARLQETGAWFDPVIPRMNAPDGLALHWTRPFDVLLLVGAWILTPALGFQRALHWAGALVSPLLQITACFTLAWAVRPLMDRRGQFLVMIALIAQPALMGYALAGRADHHMLQVLAYVWGLGLVVRAVGRPSSGATAVWAGIATGFGLWISVEFLIPLATFVGALGLMWVIRGKGHTRSNLLYAGGLAGTVALALLVERPPQRFLVAEYDRISGPHFLLCVLILTFWALVPPVAGRSSAARTRTRIVLGIAGGLVAGCILILAYPGMLENPMADMDARVWQIYMTRIAELQPLFPRGMQEVGKLIAYLGPTSVALPFVGWKIALRRSRTQDLRWLPVGLGLLAFVPLALYQIRFALWAGIVMAVGLTGALVLLIDRLNRIRVPGWRVLARAGATAALISGFLLVGGAIISSSPQQGRPSERFAEGPCDLGELADFLMEGKWGSSPRTILAASDFGPELVYRTHHSVVGAPYHRNAGAILDTYRIFTSTDPRIAAAQVTARQIDLVVLCPAFDRVFFGGSGSDDATLYGQLVARTAPPWLRQRELPDDLDRSFRLYEVMRADSR